MGIDHRFEPYRDAPTTPSKFYEKPAQTTHRQAWHHDPAADRALLATWIDWWTITAANHLTLNWWTCFHLFLQILCADFMPQMNSAFPLSRSTKSPWKKSTGKGPLVGILTPCPIFCGVHFPIFMITSHHNFQQARLPSTGTFLTTTTKQLDQQQVFRSNIRMMSIR